MTFLSKISQCWENWNTSIKKNMLRVNRLVVGFFAPEHLGTARGLDGAPFQRISYDGGHQAHPSVCAALRTE